MDAAAGETPPASGRAPRGHTRGGRPGLTRQRIVEVALGYVEAADEDSLTMRALGADLGVSAMALYRYFQSKEEILDEVVDALLGRVAPPTADPHTWATWVEEFALGMRGLLVRYPAALATFTSHPVSTPFALDRMESALGVLRAAGFDASHAARGFAAVHTYTIGFAALEVSRSRTPVPGGGGAEVSRFWHLFFGTLPADRFPNLVELAPDLAEFTSEDQFRLGLRSLLAGLGTQLARTRRRPRR